VKRLPVGARLVNQIASSNFEAFGQGQIMEKLPAQMTVIGISKPGGPEVLLPETRAVPAPGPDEILIKVAAAGVNRPDVAQRSGSYPPPPGASPLPGMEVSGIIRSLGTGVSGWAVGDRVCALLAGGGYASLAVAATGQLLPVPESLDLVDAAGLPEGAGTVTPTAKVLVAVLPAASVAVQVTVVVPTAKSEPEAGVHVALNEPLTVSVATGSV